MIRAVLFDYGGTLVRMERSWGEVKADAIRSEYQVIRRKGLGLGYEEYLKLNDSIFKRYAEVEAAEDRDIPDITKYRDILKEVFPGQPRPWREKMAVVANGAFWKIVTKNLTLMDGARPTLKRLKSEGLRMAVVSNHHNADSLVGHLTSLRISRYFSYILASSQVKFRKPDPRIIERSLAALRIDRSEAVFVGDSLEFDVEGARRAGLKSILIAARPTSFGGVSAGAGPDFIVGGLAGIPDVLSSMRPG